jgi:hypothetical protein
MMSKLAEKYYSNLYSTDLPTIVDTCEERVVSQVSFLNVTTKHRRAYGSISICLVHRFLPSFGRSGGRGFNSIKLFQDRLLAIGKEL